MTSTKMEMELEVGNFEWCRYVLRQYQHGQHLRNTMQWLACCHQIHNEFSSVYIVHYANLLLSIVKRPN